MDSRERLVTPQSESGEPEIIEYKTKRNPFKLFAGAITALREDLDATSDKLRDTSDALAYKLRKPIDKIQIAQLRKHHKLKEEKSAQRPKK